MMMTTSDRMKASRAYTVIERQPETGREPDASCGYFVSRLSNGRHAGTVAGPFATLQEAWSEIDRRWSAEQDQDPSHAEYLARQGRKLTPDEYDTAVRRIAAIDAGAAPWWASERADRRAEIDAAE